MMTMNYEIMHLFAKLTTILFCLVKIVEMKYVEKEMKPLKFIVRDAVAVFMCSLIASNSYFYMNDSFTDFINVYLLSREKPVTPYTLYPTYIIFLSLILSDFQLDFDSFV